MEKEMFIKIIAVFLCVGFNLALSPDPIVQVEHGAIKGLWKVSHNGRTYASFKGIPYAAAPIGEFRFREPQALKPWHGVWNADNYGPDCLQYNENTDPPISGNENCLFINIYTPDLKPKKALSVVIFIHGGAFMYGAGQYFLPELIMDSEIIAVTVNYRLGPLGFLSTGDEIIPGNAGLKDQSFVLHWIQKNIASFGGDPNSVTLTGCSAGGASVHYHLLSPLSKGTFARAISFSGSAFNSWAHQEKPAEKAKSLASKLGCPTEKSQEMAECLRERPAEAIAQAQANMMSWVVHKFTPFTPTTEAQGVPNAFLTEYPYAATIAGKMSKIPFLITACSHEGLYPAAAYYKNPTILLDLESNWERLASHIFEYNDTLPLDLRTEVANNIKQHYLKGQPVNDETFSQLVEALGDRLFNADIGKMAQIHAEKSGLPVYLYRYAYRATFSLSDLLSKRKVDYVESPENQNTIFGGEINAESPEGSCNARNTKEAACADITTESSRNVLKTGVSHADDILLIWNKNRQVTDKYDVQMAYQLINIISSFATNGVPTFDNVNWSPTVAGSSEVAYLEITAPNKAEMKYSKDFGQNAFWTNLGFLEREKYVSHK